MQKKSPLTYILTVLALMLGVQIMQAVSDADRRKSRHFALAAVQKAIDGDASSSHELFKKAHKLDPENLSAAYSLAMSRLAVADEEDSSSIAASLKMLRDYVDAYPADNDEGEYYAYICALTGDYDEAIRVVSRISALYPDKTDLLVTLAGYYLQVNRPDSVLSCYDRYERSEGYSPELSLRKTLVYIMKNDTAAALHEASRGIERNPASGEGYLLKGSVISYIGYPDSAAFYLKRAEQIDPQSGAIKLALARYYDEQGDSTAYAETIYEALLLDDLDLDQKIELLREYVMPVLENGGDHTRADALFATLRDNYPHDAQIQDFAAQYAYAKKDYAAAAEHIGFAVDLDPAEETYRIKQLSYLLAGGKAAEAIKAYENLPASMSTNLTALYMASAAYSMDQRPQDALAAAGKMLSEIAPDRQSGDTITDAHLRQMNFRQRSLLSDIYVLIGDTYYTLKDLPMAYLSYDNALVANPENVNALNNYAYFLAENKGDLDKALKMSKLAISLEQGNPTYIDTYAWILFRKGEFKEALDYQKSAIENMSEDTASAEYFEHLGDIYSKLGETESALENWQKALTLEPENELLKKKIKLRNYVEE